MKFIKEHSYDIFKLIINQLGIMILGLVLSFASSSHSALLLMVSIFAVGFYMVLVYTMLWDMGSKNKVRIEYNRIPDDKLLGFKLSSIAAIPNVIIAILITVGYFIRSSSTLYGVGILIGGFYEAMYIGIIKFLNSFFAAETQLALSVVWYWLIILPAIIAAGIGYIMGYYNKRIFGKTKTNGNNS